MPDGLGLITTLTWSRPREPRSVKGKWRPPEIAQLSPLASRAVAPKASCQRHLPVPTPAELLTETKAPGCFISC